LPPKMPQKTVLKVISELSKLYPDAKTELFYKDPFQLLVAVILSAQCTDERVNMTTPVLFKRYPDAKKLAAAKLSDVEKIIHSCGFFRAKSKSITSASKSLLEKFGGKVPNTIEELVTLAGVGRKTASVVLNQAFDLPAIAVDTHVKRVSRRLGWAHTNDPQKIEFELRDLIPKKHWAKINTTLILHGRRVCKARKPLCEQCAVSKLCAFYNGKTPKSVK